jgi:SMC interacting uncharacterized protein involved in chromosome segregation
MLAKELAEMATLKEEIATIEEEAEYLQQQLDEIIVALGSRGIQPSEIVGEILALRAQLEATHELADIGQLIINFAQDEIDDPDALCEWDTAFCAFAPAAKEET